MKATTIIAFNLLGYGSPPQLRMNHIYSNLDLESSTIVFVHVNTRVKLRFEQIYILLDTMEWKQTYTN